MCAFVHVSPYMHVCVPEADARCLLGLPSSTSVKGKSVSEPSSCRLQLVQVAEDALPLFHRNWGREVAWLPICDLRMLVVLAP